MLKDDAVELARRYREEFPDLAGKRIRISYSCPPGYNSSFVLYWVSLENRRNTRRLAGGTPGTTHYISTTVGSVLMAKVLGFGLPRYQSWVVTPLDEDLYHCQECKSSFTLEEKLESARWLQANMDGRPEEHYNLAESIIDLEYQIDERERYEEMWQEEEEWFRNLSST